MSPKQAHWQDFLAEFDFCINHKSGALNTMSGVLSRMPHACTISVISHSSFLQDIQTTQQHDPYTQQLISDMEMQRAAHGLLRMQQGLLMVHGKWFVPNIKEIKALILQEAHDCKMAGHGGIHAGFCLYSFCL